MLKTFDILLQVIVVQRLIIDLDDFQVLSNITTWDFA